ncbi:predicted protein [Sclerotinia sclerotiorum 1980 UF-70]|uniref:Uncharacterized protein n=1 Tax=Sclerotinia sclerotiorum (strain ATCC 18683 / 1980 / Ss-1) TaxID=665079 RepID=A7EF28_SCLS1|nr:predicted protein [Sclerotinia sclerotiorum 1980 UF-70]EDO01444.1 predicted protein [Sclerotinia sclerotiorum 1980 UF-70]
MCEIRISEDLTKSKKKEKDEKICKRDCGVEVLQQLWFPMQVTDQSNELAEDRREPTIPGVDSHGNSPKHSV